MAYKASDAIETIVKSGIASALENGPRQSSELARDLSLAEPPLRVLLDFGVRIGLLERMEQRFALTQTAMTMLPLIELELYTRSWHSDNDSLSKVLSDGRPQDPMADASQETRQLYDRALSGFTRGLAIAIRRIRGLPKKAALLDVGGGDGALASELVRLGVARQAAVLDRPYVRSHFERRRIQCERPELFSFVDADLANPDGLGKHFANADLIVLSNVVHLLSPPQRNRLWGALHNGCPPGATCLVYDQFPVSQDVAGGGSISASELMIIDWLRCGVIFDLSVDGQSEEMAACGLRIQDILHSPILPGKMIVSTTG